MSRITHDPGSGVLRTDYTFRRGDLVERRTAWIRLRTCVEIEAMLRTAGFAVVRVVDEHGQPVGAGASRAFFIAER